MGRDDIGGAEGTGKVKLWTYEINTEAGTARVYEVECPNGRYPAMDADGRRVFDNTHFDTQAEAVASVVGEATARVKNHGFAVASMRQHLLKAESCAASAAVVLARVLDIQSEFEMNEKGRTK